MTATYVVQSIFLDPILTVEEWQLQHPDMSAEVGYFPTAHAEIEITFEGKEPEIHSLCGLNVTDADTFKASIGAYIELQLQPATQPSAPVDIAALIGQPQTV